jgi:soluble cytochrome b562
MNTELEQLRQAVLDEQREESEKDMLMRTDFEFFKYETGFKDIIEMVDALKTDARKYGWNVSEVIYMILRE